MNKKSKASDLDFINALCLLKLYYGKLIDILFAVISGPIVIRDTQLNAAYVTILDVIEDILSRPDFSELNKAKPYFYETMIGNLEDASNSWEFYHNDLYDFLGKIETIYIRNGSPSLEEFKDTLAAFTELDKIIFNHKNYKKERWIKIEKQIETNAKLHNPYISNTIKPQNMNNKIYISDDDGIYRLEKEKRLAYNISGKRLKLVYELKDGKKTGPELATELDQTLQIVSQSINEINKKFKKELKIEEPLIVPVPTSGYKLNVDKLEIEFV